MVSTNITAGKVTTLEHEIGNDTVEGRPLVAIALFIFTGG